MPRGVRAPAYNKAGYAGLRAPPQRQGYGGRLPAYRVSRYDGRAKRQLDSVGPAVFYWGLPHIPMPLIILETTIDAPRERVFDLARSMDVHQDSMAHTNERAVAGVTSGLLGLDQEVTWQARHFGIVQQLKVRMTRFDRPAYFQDVMLKGAFRSMTHDHYFEESEGRTLMRDRFDFAAPLGVLGRLAEWLFLTAYMRRLLAQRNAMLKRTAESEAWRKYLGST